MMATSDIAVGEVIVSVPKTFLISNESLMKRYGRHPLSTHQLLALHLVLLSREPNSWWKSYVDLLPTHFDTMPVKYPSVLADHLPASLIDEKTQQCNKIRADYAAAVQFLTNKVSGNVTPVSYDEYEWAWLCGSCKQKKKRFIKLLQIVNTRCIHMTTTDATAKGGNIAMAPMLDFLNHTCEARIESGFNVRNQCFEIRTLIAYEEGEQVFINYGPHDNLAILKEYGFVLADNMYNFVLLDNEMWTLFDEVETRHGVRIKKDILEKAGYAGDYSIKKDEMSFRLVCALRLLALEGPENPGFERRVLDWHDMVMGETERISEYNERRMLIMLQTICKRVMQSATDEIKTLTVFSQQETIQWHPFALKFLRQIWDETIEITESILLDIDVKLQDL
ncbi:SET domain-containing protein 4 [Apophysomyces sp. BC1034]|nr:SET domain-containing protein 4 [Apophysomyces sp. BC1015]KAG0179546.1 SET domain-containing protein 4 [Apophysomyces sp. BC1021]KAG0189899.1 SET domain-containing protein 4 [Apophysomyces sp. BC1034]